MTGKEYIHYILENKLEDEPIYNGDRLLGFETVQEAAVRLRVGTATVRAWINLGCLEGYMIGNQWFIFSGSEPNIDKSNRVNISKKAANIYMSNHSKSEGESV